MEGRCLRFRLSDRPVSLGRADLLVVGLAVVGLGFLFLAEGSRTLKPQPHLQEKMAAATRAVRCFEAIRQARMGLQIPLDAESDPAGTGLIGQEFSLITTDRGVLEAKLTSVNPNFAALFVQWFLELGLERGDVVAVGLTGSFPALNICVLAAAEELGLKALPITSVGASMWGANDPRFTWLDMERLLNERQLLHTRSVAASLGGSNDRGRGLSPRGRELLRQAIERNGIPWIHEKTLEESVARRIAILDSLAGPEGVRVYVNIGGGAASMGSHLNANFLRPGINRRLLPVNWARRGVLHHYARRGIPVIHVLEIRALALAHGFPIAPERVPPVGEGNIFYREAYDLRIVVPLLLIYLLLGFLVLRERRRTLGAAAKEAAAREVAPVSGVVREGRGS
jgi:poly-gamma-glutamate system protein